MIARFLVIGCIVAVQAAIGGDQRSELKLSRPVEGKGKRAFIISAAPHKRVLVFVRDGTVSTLDISADFPYSVTLTESPTPRYKSVLIFSDRQRDTLADSFGVTPASSVERTDDDTHNVLLESAAQGRAIGEKLAKDIWGERH